MSVFHLAKSHEASQFAYSYRVGVCGNEFLSFDFDSHGSNVLDSLTNQWLKMLQLLLAFYSDKANTLETRSEWIQGLSELALCCQLHSLSYQSFKWSNCDWKYGWGCRLFESERKHWPMWQRLNSHFVESKRINEKLLDVLEIDEPNLTF